MILTRPLLIVEGLLFDDHLLAIASILLASSEDGGKTSTRSGTSSDMSGSFRSTIRGILFQYWLVALVVDGRASRDHRVADLAQTYRRLQSIVCVSLSGGGRGSTRRSH